MIRKYYVETNVTNKRVALGRTQLIAKKSLARKLPKGEHITYIARMG